MHVIITGCGRVGSQLAQFLSYDGHDVVVIDREESSFSRLAGGFNGVTITGAAFDEELLLEAGIEKADALAAVTNFDNTNLMVCEIATRIYGVPTVVTRIYNPEKRYLFNRMGVEFINGTALVAEAVMGKLLQRELIVLQERLDVGVKVVEFVVPTQAGAVPAGNLEDGVSTRILSLARASRQLKWDSGTRLREGDRLVLAAKRAVWKDVEAGWAGRGSRGGHRGASFLWGPHGMQGRAGMKVVIAGCGRVGAQLAEMLSLDDHEVTVIDRSAGAFKRLIKMFPGEVVHGLAFDIDTLKKAGIEGADGFAAVTNFDNANLMSAEVAKQIFTVPRVVARIYNPDKEGTYQALGLDYVVGTEVVARSILETILKPLVRKRGRCCGNSLDLIEFDCPEKWAGQTMAWCEKQVPVWIAYIVRGGESLLPAGGSVIEAGDEITALASERALQRLERYLRSRERR
jgi:Trk K+ transport system NAD-binding subunit